jgi:hypothetical protein
MFHSHAPATCVALLRRHHAHSACPLQFQVKHNSQHGTSGKFRSHCVTQMGHGCPQEALSLSHSPVPYSPMLSDYLPSATRGRFKATLHTIGSVHLREHNDPASRLKPYGLLALCPLGVPPAGGHRARRARPSGHEVLHSHAANTEGHNRPV